MMIGLEEAIVGLEELKVDLELKIVNENQMHWCLNFDESLKIRIEVEYSITTEEKGRARNFKGIIAFAVLVLGISKKITNASHVLQKLTLTCYNS